MNLDLNDFQDEVRRKNIAIEKSFDPFYIDPDQPLDIEKGKRAQVGEIRTHGGVKVQKQGDGSWKPVKENKTTKTTDRDGKTSEYEDIDSIKEKLKTLSKEEAIKFLNKRLDKFNISQLQILKEMIQSKREEPSKKP